MAMTISLLVDESAELEVLLLLGEELTQGKLSDVLESIFKSFEKYDATQVRRALDVP